MTSGQKSEAPLHEPEVMAARTRLMAEGNEVHTAICAAVLKPDRHAFEQIEAMRDRLTVLRTRAHHPGYARHGK